MSHHHQVKCPQCGWSGRQVGNSCDSDSWSGFEPSVTVFAFECAWCSYEWRARVIAGRVKEPPLAQFDVGDHALHWPPAEIGVGD